MASGTSELKKNLLRLLEEDEEFRYAVAAKIGLLKILEKLDEHDKKFNEILAELRKHSEKFEEHDRKFNEILERLDRNEKILLRHDEKLKKIWIKLEEHDRKFNKILERLDRHEEEIKRIWVKLEEHDRKFNEILAELRVHGERLEEHDRKFNEIVEELRDHRRRLEEHSRILEVHTRILDRHTRMLGSLGDNVGVLTEAMLSRFVRDDVFDELKLRNARVLEIRRRYAVNDYEIDLYIEAEDEIIIVEVKMRPSVRDIDRLARVRDYLVEKKGKKVRAILASYYAKTRGRVIERSEKKNIELMTY